MEQRLQYQQYPLFNNRCANRSAPAERRCDRGDCGRPGQKDAEDTELQVAAPSGQQLAGLAQSQAAAGEPRGRQESTDGA